MWTYEQSIGRLCHDGLLVGTGYAGGGLPSFFDPAAKNNPACQAEHNLGPLPRGAYTIAPAHDDHHLGPCAMPLVPDAANEMFGRGGFYMHADSVAHPGMASEGCIVLPFSVRHQVAASPDRRLTVVAWQWR